jgi:hypothetical protein
MRKKTTCGKVYSITCSFDWTVRTLISSETCTNTSIGFSSAAIAFFARVSGRPSPANRRHSGRRDDCAARFVYTFVVLTRIHNCRPFICLRMKPVFDLTCGRTVMACRCVPSQARGSRGIPWHARREPAMVCSCSSSCYPLQSTRCRCSPDRPGRRALCRQSHLSRDPGLAP